jgi:hypothetical protein
MRGLTRWPNPSASCGPRYAAAGRSEVYSEAGCSSRSQSRDETSRNEISHGFVDDVHAAVAALLVHTLVHLSSLAPTETPTSEEPGADSDADDDHDVGEQGPRSHDSSSGQSPV